MSLLSAVGEVIKSFKAEQDKINGSIQLYREILRALTLQPKTGSEDSDCADEAVTDAETSQGEREDMELLERALERALRVRAGTGPSKIDPERNQQSAPPKGPGTSVVTSRDKMKASAASKGNQTTGRLTSKSASLQRKEHKKSDGIVYHQAAKKSQQAVPASGALDRGHLHSSTLGSKNKAVRSSVLSGNDLGKAAAISTISSNNTQSVLRAEESGAHSLPRLNGVASNQIAKWKSLRSKQNRLWDKVVALQRKPVPGRSHFVERMRAAFPNDWPCGSPDQTRALVDRLTRQGHDFTQHCQRKELPAKQAPEAGRLGDKESEYDFDLTLEQLQLTAEELHSLVGQAKQEWEAWDRWRPEGGCLCPKGANDVWGDGVISPLPVTITYTTEAELRELEKLRMRVALLQQEIYLEQALLDTLSPRLSSVVPGPGCPNLSVLRDVYSLLGEGGERFPAIVRDSEPD